jgi:hypothetical protein
VFVLGAGVKYGTYWFHNNKFEENASLRAQIDAVVDKADKNDRAWAEIEQSGGPDKVRIQNVAALQRYRDTWGDLWYDLTRSLPPQNGSRIDDLKKQARGDRQQVFVESMNSQYHTDLGRMLKMDADEFKRLAVPSGGAAGAAAGAAVRIPTRSDDISDRNSRFRGGGGGAYVPPDSAGALSGAAPAANVNPDPAATGGDPAAVVSERGYLVTIQLTSPAKNALSLVENTLIKNLMANVSQANALKAGKGYYVGRAMIVSAQQISSDQARMGAIRAAYDQKRQEQEKAQNGGGGGGGGSRIAPDSRQYFPPGRGGGGGGIPDRTPPRGGFDRRPTFTPSVGRTGEDDKAAKEREKEVFADPLFPNETVLDDWELTVLVAVVLDPQPAKPTGVDAGQTASAGPAEDRRYPSAAAVVVPRR